MGSTPKVRKRPEEPSKIASYIAKSTIIATEPALLLSEETENK